MKYNFLCFKSWKDFFIFSANSFIEIIKTR